MRLPRLVSRFLRPAAAKTSATGPVVAWSGVGQPRWTPRRYETLAEAGFRKNVIAYRCVMQVATAASAIPWLLYNNHGEEIDRHPLLDLLNHPNPLQDGVCFLESVYAHLEIAGNAYIEAVRPHEDGAPMELYALRPDRMKVVPGPAGLPQAYQYSVNGQTTFWPADPLTGASNILHLKRFHPLDDWYGMAPLEAAQVSVDQHNAAGGWNQALLNHGARPSGALVFAPKEGSTTLTDDQVNRLREEFAQTYQGSKNAGRPLILEGGLDWRDMSLSPKDMDWLAGRNMAARDIALAFGVPAQLVGIPDAQTYANMAEARLALYEETILPLITRVIAGFDHWLTPMFDDTLQLDFDPDAVSAMAVRRDVQWSKLQNTNFLTINEKRHAIGYGPVEGGDVLDDGKSQALTPTRAFMPYDTAASYPWDKTKFNPNHDDLGRFTFGSGGSSEPDNNDNGDNAPAASLPNEIIGPVPQPANNDDTGNNPPYSSDEPGWHDYTEGYNMVCTPEQNCSKEEIADQLSRFSVPGRDPLDPVKDQEISWVHDPYNMGVPAGLVVTSISDDRLTITNTTKPLHVFYNGQIIRSARQGPDGAWYVITHGIGNNAYDTAPLNQWIGPHIFRLLDEQMRASIAKNH